MFAPFQISIGIRLHIGLDIESARSLITYTDDLGNPLSIYGTWDLGYEDTKEGF